jgi:hypothetical protein
MATLVFLALLFGLAALIISLLNLAEIEKHDGAINALREIQGFLALAECKANRVTRGCPVHKVRLVFLVQRGYRARLA